MDSNNNVTYTHMIFLSSFYTQSVYISPNSAVVYWRQVVYPVYVLVSHFVHFHINRRQIQDKLHRKWPPFMFAYFEKLSNSTYSRYFHNLGKEYILYITIILSVIYLKHRRMGHGFRFLLLPFLYYPLFSKFSYKSFLFQNFHNHSFFLHLTIAVDVIHHE